MSALELVGGREAGAVVDVVGMECHGERGGVDEYGVNGSNLIRRAAQPTPPLSTGAQQPRLDVSELHVVALCPLRASANVAIT